MKEQLKELFDNPLLTPEEFRTVFVNNLVPLVHGDNLVGLDRGDVEHFMDGNSKFRIEIGTGSGEKRAVDAIGEAIAKLGSVIDEVDQIKFLMYIEYGTDELMMDELTQIMDYCQDKVGKKMEMVWGVGRNDELGNQLEVLLLAGWK